MSAGAPSRHEQGAGLQEPTAADDDMISAAIRNGDTSLLELLDSLSEGFIVFQEDDRMVFCNESYRGVYPMIADLLVPGVQFETLLRACVDRGQFADLGLTPADFIEGRLRLRALDYAVHEQRLCDGRWIRVTERRLRNGWMVGTRLDITQQKQRESELERTRQQLVDALEALQEGFALFDADDRLVICNENYRSLFPLVSEMIRPGTPFEDLIRSAAERGQNIEAIADREEWVRDRLEAHARAEGSYEHQFSDGRHVLVAERKTKDGDTLSTYVDITMLKEREAELLEAKRMAEAASQAKSGFLAKMSHELRTPLNAVIGFADVLRNEMLGPIGNPEYKEFAEFVHDGGTHLLALINDLLDISKIEAGQAIMLQEDTVDLGEAIDSCYRMVDQQAQGKDIRLDVHIPKEKQLVTADGLALKRAVLNLLSNAIKFTDEGGRVDLICERGDDDDIVIRVADTGIGMEPEDIPRALEPFVQLSAVPGKPGTGLGLPIVKHLTELHGGALAIQSTPGKGTEVAIRLPASRRRPVRG